MPETRRFCPHCEEIVSLSTFLRHKQRFYNETECTWTKDSTIASSSDEMDNADDLEFESVSPQAISSDKDLNMQG